MSLSAIIDGGARACLFRRSGAGLVGLGLSYALAITGLLNSALTSWAETEQEMVAVERILDYTGLAPQARQPPTTTPPYFFDMVVQLILLELGW